ncbi:hypothetical protein [uncultured Pseudokineococcus sp.]|uniref:hypothetical protein n=1 Tax=uncultured Pseudokineococcus sp. TaxID=1642928 RepID=UPI00262E5424|nr:hypothetical protein [uncultured Pseudokineococcus sp.]
MSRTAETTGPADRAATSGLAAAAGRARALVLAGLALLASLLLGALPAHAEAAPADATVLPGGSVVVPAASAAGDDARWQLVGTPDASLVRAASVDAATGELSVEVAPGYRGRLVLVRRAVDRAAGTATDPERVVLDVAGDAPLAAGERLRLPLAADGTAEVAVPLPALEDGATYAVEAGPSLVADVDPATGDLRVAASAAGASSVSVVATAADGTAGDPLVVPVDVAPSLPGLSGATRADAPVLLPLAADVDVAVQQPATGAAAAVTPDGLEVDPRGTSGALALAVVPSAGGVVGDPAPVVVAVAPVVSPVELAGAPGDVLRAPLAVVGTGVVADVLDDAGGALAVEGDELVVTVPAGAAGELRGSLVGVDADGLVGDPSDVVVAVSGPTPAPDAPVDEPPVGVTPVQDPLDEDGVVESPSSEVPPADAVEEAEAPSPAPATDDVAPAPVPDAEDVLRTQGLVAAAVAPAPAPAAGEDLVARAAAAKLADEELRASQAFSATTAPVPAPAMELASTTAPVPAGTQLAPGLVLMDSFSTASPTTTTTAVPAGAVPTAPVAALPRTGGELVAGGALGGLALLLGLGLLVAGRRRLQVGRG